MPVIEREFREMDFMDRWQIVRTTRKQSLAAHSWLVSAYAMRIAEMLEWEGNYHDLMREALFHDFDEQVTGDLPRTVKWALMDVPGAKEAFNKIRFDFMRQRYPWWDKLNDEEKEVRMIVYLADILESLLYIIEERDLGNTNAHEGLIGHIEEQAHEAAGQLDDWFEEQNVRPGNWAPGWCRMLVDNSVHREANTFSSILDYKR